ncbi:cardiolipin synthase [Clostridium sp. DL1XJH146]
MDFVNITELLLAVLLFFNIGLAFLLIFFERKNPSVTWAWLLVLLVLPGVGFFLYLLLGQNFHKRKMFDLKLEEDMLHHKLLVQEEQLRQSSLAIKDKYVSDYEDMILMNYRYSHSLFTQNNKVEIFTNGEWKFHELLKDIRKAKHHIHLDYYIYKSDDIGNAVLSALLEKARDGVEVRVLYDAMGGRTIPRRYFDLLKEAGGKVAIFFPFILPHVNVRMNYRNHRKIAVIDGKIGYVGGMNIGDEYLGKSKRFGYWRDTHLRIKGDAVDSLQQRFLLDWRYASTEKIKFEEKYFPSKNEYGESGIQIVTSGPDGLEEQIKNAYLKVIYSAKKSIYIQSPYFVPDNSIIEALRVAALSGVDVRIMIPNMPDHPFVYWATYSYVGDLINSGVKSFKYEKGFLHAKTIVVDGKVSSVGTANMDNRSYRLNFEVNAFIYDHNIGEELQKIFYQDMEESTEITEELYHDRSIKIKFKESIGRLLAPIL